MSRQKPNLNSRDISSETQLRELSHIKSSYGRLVYLASLRNPDNGRYEHYGSEMTLPTVVNKQLGQLHEKIFREWVTFTLERKKADIELYIAGIGLVDPAELIDAWLRLTPYMNLVPATIQGPERQKHISDFEVILGLLKNVYGVASPSPDA
ncbi:MAG: hypothetical protein JO182_12960 [Acidobacteriaceae bacterium]|nr:hypothetical protein [Acidobacteriaceae bacterium]MBV9035391.1 hypothetical protein [Acidobacteriaceae bacterium]